MKLIALMTAGPWILHAFELGQLPTPDVWDIGKDLSFAALVFYLVGYSMPRMMKSHQEERSELISTIDSKTQERITEVQSMHAREDKRRVENTELLQRIAEEHAASSQSGHEAARLLAEEIKALRESLT